MMQELLELEHAGWRSLCDGTGADFYSHIMTDDGVMVLAHGQALDREGVAESLRDAPTWSAYAISDERLVVLGRDEAALVYVGRASREGTPGEFRALMSSVYVRRDGRRRLALYQQTPVPE